MVQKHQRFWTLADYQRFLQHQDPLVRRWAADRIEQQYPEQKAESLAGLLTDSDSHLRITAASAISDSGDPRYEPALLAALPASQGFVRNWFITTLGQLRSTVVLPQLIAELETVPSRQSSEEAMLACRSVADALGYYPDQAAREALERLVMRYKDDDRITYAAFTGLLRFANSAAVERLVQRHGQLRPRDKGGWEYAIEAMAEVVGVKRLAQELLRVMPEGPDEMLWVMESWLAQEVLYSDVFEDAFYDTASRSPVETLPHLLAELERAAAERGDDLPAWLADWRATGQRPQGYRWRIVYTYHLLASLVTFPPVRPDKGRETLALGLALLGQALTDQDDEARLQATSTEAERRQVLLDILGSPRQNVLPDVVEWVAALGPSIVPELIDILTGSHFWPLPRALQALARIARAHPGAADPAIPAILKLVNSDQSDYVLESASEVLIAIGPAAIEPAEERLGRVDYVYDIYVGGALSEIPTLASADALMSYIEAKSEMEEYEVEMLAALGHPAAIPFLQTYYRPGDSLVATPLYTLGLLNGYTGPEMAEWQAIALEAYASYNRLSANPKPAAVSTQATQQGQQQAGTDKKREKQQSRAKDRRKAHRKQQKRNSGVSGQD